MLPFSENFQGFLKLNFKSKYRVSIKTTEYNTDDIEKLLEILIDKSEHNIFIPENYKSNKKTAANNV